MPIIATTFKPTSGPGWGTTGVRTAHASRAAFADPFIVRRWQFPPQRETDRPAASRRYEGVSASIKWGRSADEPLLATPVVAPVESRAARTALVGALP